MGQKSTTETVSAVFQAFLEQRSWKQAELARHVGVSAPALRKRLTELQEQGLPLERYEDHPDVWWSVAAITAGVLRLARFVVGLGRAARIETPEFAAVARELARGALESATSVDTRLNEASADSNGSRG